jgi:Tfp pilus assembly protein PilF
LYQLGNLKPKFIPICPSNWNQSIRSIKCREAQAKFEHAIEVIGTSSALLYSIALCHYKQNKHGEALKYLAQVIEKVRPAPSLSLSELQIELQIERLRAELNKCDSFCRVKASARIFWM